MIGALAILAATLALSAQRANAGLGVNLRRADYQQWAAHRVAWAEGCEQRAQSGEFPPQATASLLTQAHDWYRFAWHELELGAHAPGLPDPNAGPDIRALARRLRDYNRGKDHGYFLWVCMTTGRFCKAYGQMGKGRR